MVTKDEIMRYHSKTDVAPEPQKTGIELELFCINRATLQRILYASSDIQNKPLSIQDLFTYLIEYQGYEASDATKTFGLKKGGTKITLEPGSQIEYCSAAYIDIKDLLTDFQSYTQTLRALKTAFPIEWLNTSYFPLGKAEDVPLIPHPRYEIMSQYFSQTGRLGRSMMCHTTSLQITFDYVNIADLEEKVTRALWLKPILLFISANSAIREGEDTRLRSFRTMTYRDADGPRMGTPALDTIWRQGRWTLESYVEKVLQAPMIFALGTTGYQAGTKEPFYTAMSQVTFEDYLLHHSTIWTDIRVRQYFEIRYLDNPGLSLVPGLALIMNDLFYNEDAWQEFSASIPYHFSEVPMLTDLLNFATPDSDHYWQTNLLQPVERYLYSLQERLDPALAPLLDPILEKVQYFHSDHKYIATHDEKQLLRQSIWHD